MSDHAEPVQASGPAGSRITVAGRRNAVGVVFGLAGFGTASWLSRVPGIRDALHATTGQMGVLALGISIGSVLGFTLAARFTRLAPSRTISFALTVAAIGLMTAAIGTAVLGVFAVAFAGLVLLGLGTGMCNVTMNVEAAAVEREIGRPIMPRFHAVFSIGGVVGAGLGTAATALHIGLVAHLAVVAVLVVGGVWFAVRFLRPGDSAFPQPQASRGRQVTRQKSAWLEPRTLLIGLVVLGMSFATGSANDWIALSMVEGHGVNDVVGAMTYGVFVVTMTAGRLFGVQLLARFGRVRVVQASAVMAAIGLFSFIFVPNPVVAVIAASLWGLGAALGFPIGMSAAADDPVRASARIGVVATIGYGASLGGPPAVGFLGEHVGLLHALLLVVALVLAAGIVAPVLRRRSVPLDA